MFLRIDNYDPLTNLLVFYKYVLLVRQVFCSMITGKAKHCAVGEPKIGQLMLQFCSIYILTII